MNRFLPPKQTLYISSLSEYVERITRFLTGEIKPDEEEYGNISLGRNIADSILRELKQDNVASRLNVYGS